MAIYLNFGGFLFASLAKTIWFGAGGGALPLTVTSDKTPKTLRASVSTSVHGDAVTLSRLC